MPWNSVRINLFVLLTENRAGPSNLGNVISQILLCKTIRPDFNQEELCSITKDSQDVGFLLGELQPYMPKHEAYLGKSTVLEFFKMFSIELQVECIHEFKM